MSFGFDFGTTGFCSGLLEAPADLFLFATRGAKFASKELPSNTANHRQRKGREPSQAPI